MPDRNRSRTSVPVSFPLSRALPAALMLGVAACAPLAESTASDDAADVNRTYPAFSLAVTSAIPAQDADPAAGNPSSHDEPNEEVVWLAGILNNPANDLATRAGAAARLLRLEVPGAMDPLREALRSRDAGTMLPVIQAMHGLESPPMALLSAAVDALRSAPAEIRDPLALMLVQYDDTAVPQIAAVAHSTALPPDERIGAIHALGPFHTRAATIELMKLLDEARNEPPAIIAAATAALQRATGLPYGNTPQPWRAWWAEAHNQPREEWLTKLVKRLADQLTVAEQEIQRQRDTTNEIERRLAEAYRELFPRQSLEEQFASLTVLLEDPISSVRSIAIDRISRLLRDSVPIPAELQRKLIDRLNDSSPDLRLQAARLLDQMNLDTLPTQLAAALSVESTPEVTAGFLEILARRPALATIDAVRPLLTDATHGERAAAVLWEVLNLNGIDADVRHELRTSVLDADRWRDWPNHARLLARLADDDELSLVEPLLDSSTPEMRLAVAEGLYKQRRTDLLADRAEDETIYPFAVRCFAEGEPTLEQFRRLLSHRPNESQRTIWNDAVTRLAARLAPADLIAADDMLAGIPELPKQLRAEVLSRVPSLPDDALSSERRTTLTARLAAILLRLDQAPRALEILDTLNGTGSSVMDVEQLRFEASLLSGRFDLAYNLNDQPGPWVSVLSRQVDRQPELAAALSEEITRRFGEQLTGQLRAEYESLRDRLPSPPASGAGESSQSPS